MKAKRRVWIALVLILLLAPSLMACTFLPETRPRPGMTILSAGPQETKVTVILHVPESSTGKMARLEHQTTRGAESLWMVALRELMSGSLPDNIVSPLPRMTRLVSEPILQKGILFLNFSGDIEILGRILPGRDRAMLGSLVLTLTEVADVKAVQILVDGRKRPDLGGQIKTSSPLTRNLFVTTPVPK